MGFFGNGVDKRLLDKKLRELGELVNDPELIERIREYCLETPKEQLFAIDLGELESKWAIGRDRVIPAFLHATKIGLFTMQYVLNCTHCNGQAQIGKLANTQHIMTCPSCQGLVKTSVDKTLEIRFQLSKKLASYKQPKAHKHYIRAIEVLNTDEFRALFESERPLPGEHLYVNNLTFLFTDLNQSTATYEKLGDGTAYRIVREHFALLFKNIRKHRGSVVKTIGDAVMATFLSPADAVACAMDSFEDIKAFNKRQDVKGLCSIKVGVHSGDCLGVTLSNRLDFFGSTVNRAARVQQVADKDELVVSKKVYEKNEHLFENTKPKHKKVTMKGFKKQFPVVIVRP